MAARNPTGLGDAPLNLLPKGLLDLFGIKSFGQYPQRLLQDIVPTTDLLDWYERTNASWVVTNSATFLADTGTNTRSITSTVPVDLVAGAGDLIVPANEYWLLFEVTTQLGYPNDAAAGGEAWLAYSVPQTGLFMPPTALMGPTTGVAAIARLSKRAWLTHAFAPPGSTILHQHSGITVGAGVVSLTSQFRLLRLRQ